MRELSPAAAAAAVSVAPVPHRSRVAPRTPAGMQQGGKGRPTVSPAPQQDAAP